MIPVRHTGSEHFYFILSSEKCTSRDFKKFFFFIKASIGNYYLL